MLLTSHAVRRAQQRAICREDIETVVANGTRVHNGGALFVFMGWRDIPVGVAPALRDRLEGITIVMDPVSEDIITAYRNKGALRDIKRKRKQFSPSESHSPSVLTWLT
jgi:hypothetical protein